MKKSILLILTVMFTTGELFAQKFGNCINLDGNDDYLVVPHNESLNPGISSWSVAFWIQAADDDQLSPVVMKRSSDYPYAQYLYGFGEDDPHNPEPGRRIYVNYIESAGNAERSGHTAGEFIDGNWHHIAIVADQATDGITTYVDGGPVEFVPLYYSGPWPNVSNMEDLIIGCYFPPYCIEGPLDELCIWNKALTREKVQMVMNDTIPPAYYNNPDSGLVAYYRFEAFVDLGISGGGTDDIRGLSYLHNHADGEGNPELIPSGIPVGIDEVSDSSGLSIFPNPTHGKFQITTSGLQTNPKFQTQKIEVMDLYGKLVISWNMEQGSWNREHDISFLPAGIYFIRIHLESQTIVKKIIKL